MARDAGSGLDPARGTGNGRDAFEQILSCQLRSSASAMVRLNDLLWDEMPKDLNSRPEAMADSPSTSESVLNAVSEKAALDQCFAQAVDNDYQNPEDE